jgi:hypothetical protein
MVDQFYEGLYRFALGLSGKTSDAADLTQENYHILLVKGDRIHDPNRVKSWLFTTLYREFLRRRRHLIRFPEHDLEEVDSELLAVEGRHLENLDAALVASRPRSPPETNGWSSSGRTARSWMHRCWLRPSTRWNNRTWFSDPPVTGAIYFEGSLGAPSKCCRRP